MIFIFQKLFLWLLTGDKGRNKPRMAQKIVPSLEINRSVTFLFVTLTILKIRIFFFLSEAVLLYETIIKA